MVPPDSHEISRVPCYLGTRPGATTLRLQGYHLLCRDFPDPSTSAAVYNSSPDQQLRPDDPTTPHRQHLPAITPTRFSLFRFRSPLLTESLLFSPQQVLRCFTSPPHHQPAYTFSQRQPVIKLAGLPHSETLGSQSSWQLPQAYRSLTRPSSVIRHQGIHHAPYTT